jgi:hypothetical protein
MDLQTFSDFLENLLNVFLENKVWQSSAIFYRGFLMSSRENGLVPYVRFDMISPAP